MGNVMYSNVNIFITKKQSILILPLDSCFGVVIGVLRGGGLTCELLKILLPVKGLTGTYKYFDPVDFWTLTELSQPNVYWRSIQCNIASLTETFDGRR